jgi:hypothetical protein
VRNQSLRWIEGLSGFERGFSSSSINSLTKRMFASVMSAGPTVRETRAWYRVQKASRMRFDSALTDTSCPGLGIWTLLGPAMVPPGRRTALQTVAAVLASKSWIDWIEFNPCVSTR